MPSSSWRAHTRRSARAFFTRGGPSRDAVQLSEPGGAMGKFTFVYRNHDTHIVYGEGTYEGALSRRPVKGRSVLVLKCGYIRETKGFILPEGRKNEVLGFLDNKAMRAGARKARCSWPR